MDGDNLDEKFPPTGGRVVGVLAVVVSVAVCVLGLVDDPVAWVAVTLGVLFAALAWAALLRPRVSIEDDELVLRGIVDTVRLPLAGVEEVVVRQVLAVRVGEKRYTSPAIGQTRRQINRDARRSGDAAGTPGDAGQAFAVFVEERIRSRAEDARARLGVRTGSAGQQALTEQVRRVPAVAEITLLAASAVAVVVAFVV
jgi:hypothetical protein